MNNIKILRKRYIPDEIVDISGDEILSLTDDLIVTRWKPIRPRKDISGGVSYTFINKGYKISKFYDLNNNLLYWYCDIIEVMYQVKNRIYTLVDLLLDVKVMPDGTYYVLDVDEFSFAYKNNLISKDQVCMALNNLATILDMIYNKEFPPKIILESLF